MLIKISISTKILLLKEHILEYHTITYKRNIIVTNNLQITKTMFFVEEKKLRAQLTSRKHANSFEIANISKHPLGIG